MTKMTSRQNLEIFELSKNPELTNQEIGDRYGITETRVRQIKKKMLERQEKLLSLAEQHSTVIKNAEEKLARLDLIDTTATLAHDPQTRLIDTSKERVALIGIIKEMSFSARKDGDTKTAITGLSKCLDGLADLDKQPAKSPSDQEGRVIQIIVNTPSFPPKRDVPPAPELTASKPPSENIKAKP